MGACLKVRDGGREGGVLISYDASLVLGDGVRARERLCSDAEGVWVLA